MAKKGHHFDVAVMVAVEAIFVILLGYMAYAVLIQEGGQAAGLAAVLILALPAFAVIPFRPGRYVVVRPELGLSKPMWSRRKDVRIIPWTRIQSFERVHSFSNRETIIGLVLHTDDGKTLKYSERKTPSCVSPILNLLTKQGVRELSPAKIRIG